MFEFVKVHAAGNDFAIFPFFNTQAVKFNKRQIQELCNRQTGIGADGVVILTKDGEDFAMQIFNSDGSRAAMCGNALRCVGKYLFEIFGKTKMVVKTASGPRRVFVCGKNQIKVEIGAPRFTSGGFISVGNLHKVHFVKNLEGEILGPHLGNEFNSEFISVINEKTLQMRVWERGAGETRSCGTGAAASVAAAVFENLIKPNTQVTVRQPGGNLRVLYKKTKSAESIFITGAASIVFSGVIKNDK